MSTVSRSRHLALPDALRRHTPATLAIYALCAYVALISLYQLLLGINVRLAGRTLALPGDTSDPIYELGTSLGFWGFLLFGLNFVLATRWRWVERLVGGLDRVYTLHGLMGRWTMVLIVLHLAVLTIQALPDWSLATTYIVPGLDLSYSLGGAGTLLLALLVAATLWARWSYELWLASHRWMGLPYLLGGAHAIVAQGDWYLWLMTIAGGYAWAYSAFLYRRLGPRYAGIVGEVRSLGAITELTIRLDRPHHCTPGQFVFLEVTRSAAGLPAERHPFSVSAILDAATLRLSVKRLGDFTAHLADLTIGDRVAVYGGYGMFGVRALASGDALWVAGGIGVTPFLSLLRHIAAHGSPGGGQITMVWSVREAEEAVYLAEIQALAGAIPGLRVHLHVTTTNGRLTGDQLAALLVPTALDGAHILLCGPLPMMRALAGQLTATGARPSRIISEEFSLR